MLTTVHNFDNTDGSDSQARLIQATNGDLYGTTYGGGANGAGTVFKITLSGLLTTLHNFCSQINCEDGALPNAGLIQATDGDFYGTTVAGGSNDYGTVFKITPSGKLTTLHSFCLQASCTDGRNPYAELLQATNGDFYGTTEKGGTKFLGTVFSLSTGLGPFVKTQTTSGKVGAAVKILGSSLTGATSVTFNATAATFEVLSNFEIKTTVPAGASTGVVQVVTPSGTLDSNVVYTVKP